MFSRRSSARRLRGVILVLVVGLVMATNTGGPASAGPPERGNGNGRPEERHESGLAVLDATTPEVDELPEDVSGALAEATTLTENNPERTGYAWVDRSTGELVIDAADDDGERKAREFRPSDRGHGVKHKVRRVTFSRGHLERVKDEAIDIGPLVPDGDLIFRTEPDPAANRVVISVERMSDPLLHALAARYGVEAIAIRIDPDRPSLTGRRDDTSPFWGGARIKVEENSYCSDGFTWRINSTTDGMLTAGHCKPAGGYVQTTVSSMGFVSSGTRESWTRGVGTVYMTGQSVYRGDIALIQVAYGNTASARMYRGDTNSITSSPVRAMWSRRAQVGDRYCTGGYRTGEMCGWRVDRVGINIKYNDGEGTGRNLVEGSKQDQCTLKGDSGGPVFTVQSDGGIVAKGLISGGGGGGDDDFGGAWDRCRNYFTDIWEAYYGFPGVLKTG